MCGPSAKHHSLFEISIPFVRLAMRTSLPWNIGHWLGTIIVIDVKTNEKFRDVKISCHFSSEEQIQYDIVTRNWLKSQNRTLFLHVWRRGGLALDPLQNKSCSEFFSQAYKNWHITWGNNLGPDWPPLARGSKFHTITHPPGRFLPSPRQWKIMSL